METATNSLKDYKEANAELDLRSDGNVIGAGLSDLMVRAAEARAKRLDLEKQLGTAATVTDSKRLLEISSIATLPEIRDLRTTIREKAVAFETLKKTFGYKHQTYIEAETDQKALGEKILQSYPDSIYSDFVRLNEAKRNYIDGDFDASINLLIYILENKSMSPGEFDPIIAVAQTRLAKIYIEQQNFNEVISIFESTGEMTSSMHELKGDAHNGLGQFSLARESFMLALQNSTNQTARAIINMKISESDLSGDEYGNLLTVNTISSIQGYLKNPEDSHFG